MSARTEGPITTAGSLTITGRLAVPVAGGLSCGTSLAFTNAVTPMSARGTVNCFTRILSGTLNAPGLTIGGRLIALGSSSITAPVTSQATGAIEVRSSGLGSSVNLTVSNGFTNNGLIELMSYNAGYTSTFTVTNGNIPEDVQLFA